MRSTLESEAEHPLPMVYQPPASSIARARAQLVLDRIEQPDVPA